MRNDAEAVIQGLYSAWTLQDVDTTLAFCHDDVAYRVLSSDGRWQRLELSGRSEVRGYLEAMCAVWEWHPEDIQPGPLIFVGNFVIREQFSFRCIHRRSGLEFTGSRRHEWTVEEGRITSCTEYIDAGALDAFLRMAEACCRPVAGMPLVAYSGLIASLAGLN